MAPNIKLTYFNCIRGRIEIIRLILKYTKVPFEDNAYDPATWPAVKAKTMFGVVPEIEIDGKTHIQSLAIATYLAREHGLYGSSNMDGFILDQLQQVREELLILESKIYSSTTEEDKAKLQKTLDEDVYPKTLKYFTDFIKNNSTKSGFAMGDKPTLADFVIFEGVENLISNNPSGLDPYPEIKALRENFAALDGIKQYLANRKTLSL